MSLVQDFAIDCRVTQLVRVREIAVHCRCLLLGELGQPSYSLPGIQVLLCEGARHTCVHETDEGSASELGMQLRGHRQVTGNHD